MKNIKSSKTFPYYNGLKSGFLSIFLFALFLLPLACSAMVPGNALILYVTSTPTTEKNRYHYNEYPAKEFFIDAYMKEFVAKCNEKQNGKGLTLKLLRLANPAELAIVEELLLDPSFNINLWQTATAKKAQQRPYQDQGQYLAYRYINSQYVVFQKLPAQEQAVLLRSLAPYLSGRYDYIVAIDMKYSLVDQSIKNRITVVDSNGKLLMQKKVPVRSRYILYDSASPYLFNDNYLARPVSPQNAFAEVETLAHHLSELSCEKFIKKIARAVKADT